MKQPARVFELDTDALMGELLHALLDRGYDVVEQVPAGVWWFRTTHDANSVAGEIGALLQPLLTANFREIEQS